MRKLIAVLAISGFLLLIKADLASAQARQDTVETVAEDSAAVVARDSSASGIISDDTADNLSDDGLEAEESTGFHTRLKTKFIEGNAGFMSLVAIALVLGLAFCIERIIYLTLSEINAKRFMRDLEGK